MRAIRDIHEITPWNQGLIIGIDEVGRGSVMGPVITCACLFETWDGPQTLRGLLNDSKKLSHTSRAKAVDEINKLSIRYAFGSASRNEIDSINISKATNLAMARAVRKLNLSLKSNVTIIIDGNPIPYLEKEIKQISVIKGDGLVPAIMAASILAKEFRDNLMKKLHLRYPIYKINTNSGYGTKAHMDAIKEYGLSQHHRKSFLSNYLTINNSFV